MKKAGIMEYWDDGILNINRGYRKLIVWQRAMDLSVLVYKNQTPMI